MASSLNRQLGGKGKVLWYLLMVLLASSIVDRIFGKDRMDTIQAAMGSRQLTDTNANPNEADDTVAFNVLTSFLVVVLCLIGLTIFFEALTDFMKEHTSDNMKPIVEKLFAELTVLGFLSMFTFALSSTGAFSDLSYTIFGNRDSLGHIIDEAHYTIFCIMIFFVIQVVTLMQGAMATEKEWLELESRVRDPSKAERIRMQAMSFYSKPKQLFQGNILREMFFLMPGLRRFNPELTEDEVLFKALRDEFLLERSVDPPFDPAASEHRLTPDFSFGRYFAICLGQMVSHVVNLEITSWLFLAFVSVLYYGYILAVGKRLEVLAWTWVFIAWTLYVYNLYFERHLIHVRRAFAPKAFFHEARRARDLMDMSMSWSIRGRKWGTDETTFLKHEDGGDETLPLWTDVDVDAYMATRSLWARWLVGGRPNRQQTFYWMDRLGPRYYPMILQVNLIFIGIFVAMNVLGFVRYMYVNFAVWVFIVYCVLAIVPFCGVVFFKRNLVSAMSQVCCLGAYRRPDIVAKVIREEMTIRAVRAFLIIYKLRKIALETDPELFQERKQSHRNLMANMTGRIEMDPIEYKEVAKTFDAFDTSGDGKISYEEFEALMENIGAAMSKESLQRMIGLLDEDGNNEVTRDEFMNWYALNASAVQTATPEEQAHFLFHLFDDDESGSLTIGEFKLKLDALNMGFSVDDIGAIVHELDSDGNGSIGLEEFCRLIKKHYPKELAHGKNGHGRT